LRIYTVFLICLVLIKKKVLRSLSDNQKFMDIKCKNCKLLKELKKSNALKEQIIAEMKREDEEQKKQKQGLIFINLN